MHPMTRANHTPTVNTWGKSGRMESGQAIPAQATPVITPGQPREEPTEPLFPACGETFADCQLLVELGSAPQSRVFLATQPLLANRPVVLKLTPCDGQEHLALARLLHAHIVPLHFVQDFPARNLRMMCMPYLG